LRRFASHSSAEPFISGASWFRLLPYNYFHCSSRHFGAGHCTAEQCNADQFAAWLRTAGCYRSKTSIALPITALLCRSTHIMSVPRTTQFFFTIPSKRPKPMLRASQNPSTNPASVTRSSSLSKSKMSSRNKQSTLTDQGVLKRHLVFITLPR